jgi:chorismate dehydratase
MRVGLLKSVNALPVTLGLECGAVPFPGELLRGEPSWLNQQARAGQLDLTVVSAAEVAAAPGAYRVIPGFCVGAREAVQSVRLFSRIPLEELPGQPVAITSASATSRILVQVLLPGIQPVPLLGEPSLDDRVPAVLLIGDRALGEVPGTRHVADLGVLWNQATGLPMVFALWVTTRAELASAGQDLLERSRAWGQAHPSQVVQEASQRTGLSCRRLEDYFAGLHHRLDADSVAGLREFYRRAGLLGLLPAGGEDLLGEVAA